MLFIRSPEIIHLLISNLFLFMHMLNKLNSSFLEISGYSVMNDFSFKALFLPVIFSSKTFHQIYIFHKLGMLCNALPIDCQLQRTKKVKQINAIKYASANYSLITAFKMKIASNDFLQKSLCSSLLHTLQSELLLIPFYC